MSADNQVQDKVSAGSIGFLLLLTLLNVLNMVDRPNKPTCTYRGVGQGR